jgi:branched-chain amino acid transport system substrate-binding protein
VPSQVFLKLIAHIVTGTVLSTGALAAPPSRNSSGPGNQTPVGRADAGPIVIGISNVQSGPSRALGQNLTRGSMTYFDLVNRAGGIAGRKIQVVLKDDRYEPDPAVQNTNDLILKDNVLALFGYVGTPTLTRTLPLLRYYEDRNIVNIGPFTGAEPQRRPPYDRYVFNIRVSYREETRRLVDYLVGKGHVRIGFMGQADAYGKSGEAGVVEALAAHGMALAEAVTYRRNQPYAESMKPQVERLREKRVDAVIMVGVYGGCGAFVRDARQSGWNVPIAGVSFVGAEEMLAQLTKTSAEVGRDLTVGLINSQVVPSPEETQYPLVVNYRAHIPPGETGFVSLEGWLNAVVLVEALKRAGPSASRTGLISAMESLHGWDPGIGVKLKFDRGNHQGLHKVWLTRTERGRWIPIHTE